MRRFESLYLTYFIRRFINVLIFVLMGLLIGLIVGKWEVSALELNQFFNTSGYNYINLSYSKNFTFDSNHQSYFEVLSNQNSLYTGFDKLIFTGFISYSELDGDFNSGFYCTTYDGDTCIEWAFNNNLVLSFQYNGQTCEVNDYLSNSDTVNFNVVCYTNNVYNSGLSYTIGTTKYIPGATYTLGFSHFFGHTWKSDTSIINNQNNNTQDIINNQNQNNQAILDNQDKLIKGDCEMQPVKNLLDPTKINTLNNSLYYIGTNYWYSNNNLTDLVELEANTTYTFSINEYTNDNRYTIMDSSKTALVREAITSSKYVTFTTTQKSWFHFYANNLTTTPQWQLEKSSNVTPFEPYELKNVCKGGLTENINDVNKSINDVNNTLNDDSGTSSQTNNELVDTIGNSFGDSDDFLLQLLLIPYNFFTAIINATGYTCTPYNLGNFFGTDLILPCIDLEDILGSTLYHIIDVIFSGIIAFGFINHLKHLLENVFNLSKNAISNMDIQVFK